MQIPSCYNPNLTASAIPSPCGYDDTSAGNSCAFMCKNASAVVDLTQMPGNAIDPTISAQIISVPNFQGAHNNVIFVGQPNITAMGSGEVRSGAIIRILQALQVHEILQCSVHVAMGGMHWKCSKSVSVIVPASQCSLDGCRSIAAFGRHAAIVKQSSLLPLETLATQTMLNPIPYQFMDLTELMLEDGYPLRLITVLSCCLSSLVPL